MEAYACSAAFVFEKEVRVYASSLLLMSNERTEQPTLQMKPLVACHAQG